MGWVSCVPIEVSPPKYVVIVNAIQRRIEDGTYPPGSKIPSETELVAEFATSRPVVVRALGLLQQEGWIEPQQGRGRFVRGRPASARPAPPRVAGLLDRDETAGVAVISAGPMLAPHRAAAALDVGPDTPVIARQLLVVAELGPVELATVYAPVELAAGTAMASREPIPAGLLRHLARRKGVVFDHATERISARPATAEEADLLKLGEGDCLLTALVSVRDRAGAPQLAIDAAIPPTRHEIEDAFPVSLS